MTDGSRAPHWEQADLELEGGDANEVDDGDAIPRLPDPTAAEGRLRDAEQMIRGSLISLGFVNFDLGPAGNDSSTLMASEDRRRYFRRDVYVGIKDHEQGREFLGRIVEGPFHSPHEISADSAISRVTVLYPERTRFRPTYFVHGRIEVLGEIREGDRVVPTSTRPRPYSEVYVFPPERLRPMLGIDGTFFLGHLLGYPEVRVHLDAESKNFLPRNVAIFGTVGSGKSNTTQVLIEEALAAGWAVVVVDVEGEYVRMDEPSTDEPAVELLRSRYGMEPAGVPELRVYVPPRGSSDAVRPLRFKVPISQVAPEILADVLELTEPQSRMLHRIMEQADQEGRERLAQQRRGSHMGVLARGGLGSTRPRPFDLQTLIDMLRSQLDGTHPRLRPSPHPSELSTVHTLWSKLVNLDRSDVLDRQSNEDVEELPVDELLVGGRLSVLDVSEASDRSRNMIISYLLQALFDRVVETDVGATMPNGRQRPKVLVIIEEVHTFVSRSSATKMRAVVDQLQVISRRGRKRWMGLVLVSQQPGHVPDELFELANTRFVHQIKSASNLAPVKQTTGDVHEALWTILPALGPGQCLLTGTVVRNPIFAEIRPARSRRLLAT